MNATAAPLKVGLAGPIQADAELLTAVREATSYLEGFIEEQRLEPSDRTLDWACSEEPKPSHVIAVIREADRYGSRHASRMTTRARFLDPVARDVFVLDVFRDVLRQRWDQVGVAIDRGLEELAREESANAHSD
jgi:hypothetical protein